MLTLGIEPPNWDFVLFYKYSRKEQWAVDDRVIKWAVSRFYQYDNIRGPEGLTERLFNRRLRGKRKEWKQKLVDTVLSKFCLPGEKYDYSYIIGEDASAKELAKAEQVCHRPIYLGYASHNQLYFGSVSTSKLAAYSMIATKAHRLVNSSRNCFSM